MAARLPRLLLVGNFLSASRGSYAVCEALSARLQGEGWSVVTTSRFVGRGARVVDMVHTTLRRRHDYDIAHIDLFSGAAFAWAEAVGAVLRALGKPFILSLHGGALPEFAAAHPDRVRRLLDHAAAVTAPSRFLLDRMQPYAAEVRLHPNPIDARLFPFRLRAAPQPRLLWLRAFHEVYNPSLAVAVLGRLSQRFPGATLTMVGPDKGDGSLAQARALADREGLTSRLNVLGGIPARAVPGVLAAHDVFLNTANTDNTPVSVLEALACGLLTVSTNAGGVPYLLTHGDDSLVVPVGDAAAMTDAVTRILTTPELAARLGAGARATAECHDWSRVLSLWTELFQSTAAATVALRSA